ncbi:unnamed protein product [Spirodela intermedia]|uniref:Uncharacterized protein n=1 Tax=Spirodela intermedia TaxID=51605 RepID=A0A7I8J088_SPIIN|nr:unnamed protein product [Spirodela intermedia]CAA6662720.1 unnamed protein product [Spirodela intermedia]
MPAGHGVRSRTRDLFARPFRKKGYIPLTTYLRTYKIGTLSTLRIIRKRIHVRVEHVQPSRCAEEFRLRKIKNDELKREAKARGEKISTKRQPEGPKPGFLVEGTTLETVTPIPYDVVNDLKGGY